MKIFRLLSRQNEDKFNGWVMVNVRSSQNTHYAKIPSRRTRTPPPHHRIKSRVQRLNSR